MINGLFEEISEQEIMSVNGGVVEDLQVLEIQKLHLRALNVKLQKI